MADQLKVRNLDNEEYWRKRTEARLDHYWKEISKAEKELGSSFRSYFDEIRQLVLDLYTNYATNDQLTYQELTKKLSERELQAFKSKIQRILQRIKPTNNTILISELEKLLVIEEMTRLQSVMYQVETSLNELSYEQQLLMEEWLSNVYEGNYYDTIYQVMVGTGVAFTFDKLNEGAIREAITYAWSNDQFSDRIWTNKQDLVKNIRQTIVEGTIKGESNQKMARKLKEKMNSNYSNALRLVRTESAYILTESTRAGYVQNEVVSLYQILVPYDERTCDVCKAKNNKVYDLKDYDVGKTAPIFHPNCRCCIAPYFSEENYEEYERIAKVGDERLYVPANMTFEEFEDKYVNNRVPS